MAKVSKRKKQQIKDTAYIIHEKLHLSYAQCVQLLLTNHRDGHIIANRNIEKHNAKTKDAQLSLFDQSSFNNLLDQQIAWAN
jgi:hypothetical protein